MNWKLEVLEKAKQGESWRKIAKELGVPKSTCSDWLRKHFKDHLKGDETKATESTDRINGPKILFIDVETSPIISHVWGLWNNNVGLNQIEADWHLLSFCAKWAHSEDVIYSDQRDQEDIEDDYSLLLEIWHLLNEADWVIGHNAKSFDVKKINARLVLNGLPKPSPFKVVDTLEIAKRNFKFTSNRLQYLTDNLCEAKKLNHSKFPGHTLWTECMKGNKEAWDEMKAYNIADVLSLEELFYILASWDNSLPSEDVYVDDILDMSQWEKFSFHYTALGKYQVYRNKLTGQQKRSRVNLLSKEKRDSLLVNIK